VGKLGLGRLRHSYPELERKIAGNDKNFSYFFQIYVKIQLFWIFRVRIG